MQIARADENAHCLAPRANNRLGAVYLPEDDRRTYCAWSDANPLDLSAEFWNSWWEWFEQEGAEHIAAFLKVYDISWWNAKAPPKKTPWFHEIVGSNIPAEEDELANLLGSLGNPDAVTISLLLAKAGDMSSFGKWLHEMKSRLAVPHKMERCGYTQVFNQDSDRGRRLIAGKRQTVFGKRELTPQDRFAAARALQAEIPTDVAADYMAKKHTAGIAEMELKLAKAAMDRQAAEGVVVPIKGNVAVQQIEQNSEKKPI